ncbi:MAG: hypothetical protein ACLFRD_00190 [Nitriliruptoraceae bacterium]
MNEALVLLALVWAALLVPAALRARAASPHATVGGFERAMDVLRSGSYEDHQREPITAGGSDDQQRPAPAATYPRHGEDAVIVRRRLWFLRGLVGTAASLLLAVLVGGWLWLPAVVITVLTASYTVVLRYLKLQRDAAREVVRELDLTGPEPQLRERVGEGEDAVALEREPVAVGGPTQPERSDAPGSGTVRLRRWDG